MKPNWVVHTSTMGERVHLAGHEVDRMGYCKTVCGRKLHKLNTRELNPGENVGRCKECEEVYLNVAKKVIL